MLFNSIHFLLFFPLVVALYFALPYRYRWVLLLAASYYFYMVWKPVYALLLLGTTSVTYWSALRVAAAPSPQGRRFWLAFNIVVLLSVLFFFKYFNFLNDNLMALLQRDASAWPLQHLNLLLPVGISFYTFQKISYIIEVYFGRCPVERHFGIFALYSCFFPQLVAGPIERPSHLLPQFYERHDFDYDRAVRGLKLMAWGFFKKVVVADRLAVFVNAAYAAPDQYQGLGMLWATVLFAFQIFCDFSGYSDIALGSAEIMGFHLIQNFRRPYHAASITDFWRRWHISLSSWFRDYLYIPLGGNRVTVARWCLNIMVVFVVSGFWHGASWTFVIWGGLHGLLLVLERITSAMRNRFWVPFGPVGETWRKGLGTIYTFVAVCVTWVFFRAKTLPDALNILGNLGADLRVWTQAVVNLNLKGLMERLSFGQSPMDLCLALLALTILEVGHLFQRKGDMRTVITHWPTPWRWAAYYAFIMLIVLLMQYPKGAGNAFIYFQF